MIETYLAYNYFKRGWKEAFISVFSIAVTIAFTALAFGISNGLGKRTLSNILNLSPHIKLGYLGKNVGKEELKDILKKIESQNGVKAFSKNSGKGFIKRKIFKTFLSEGVSIEGYSQQELEYRGFNDKIIDGNMFEDEKEVMLGKELADRLALSVGSTVTLLSTKNIEKEYRVCGIFSSGFYEYDLNVCLVPLSIPNELFELKNENIEINIILDDIYEAENIAQWIKCELNIDARPWHSINRQLLRGLNLEKRIVTIFLAMLFILVALLINGAMSSFIRARKKDIGILKAMGVGKWKMFRIFLYFSLMVYIVGVGLSIPLFYFMKFIIDNYTFGVISQIYYIEDNLPFLLSTKNCMVILSYSLTTNVLGALSSILRASNLSPIKVLRNE